MPRPPRIVLQSYEATVQGQTNFETDDSGVTQSQRRLSLGVSTRKT